MSYERIAAAVYYGEPWAITADKLAVIVEVLELRRSGVRFTAEEIQQRIGAAPQRPVRQQAGAVAVLPVFGVLAQRMGMMEEMSGGTSTEALSAQFRQFMADPGVKAIVLNIDSPGGSVYGIPELAAEIHAARGNKPVIAQANSLAASAAYWLASQADEVVITPGGEAGSIGVLAGHRDMSKALDMGGERVTLITAGKYKSEGNPYEPLGEEARAAIQERINEYYGMFVKDVARGRGRPVAEVRGGFGEGRVVGAAEAVRLGVSDRVATLADTLRRLGANPEMLRSVSAGADVPAVAAETDNGEIEIRRRRLALLPRSRG